MILRLQMMILMMIFMNHDDTQSTDHDTDDDNDDTWSAGANSLSEARPSRWVCWVLTMTAPRLAPSRDLSRGSLLSNVQWRTVQSLYSVQVYSCTVIWAGSGHMSVPNYYSSGLVRSRPHLLTRPVWWEVDLTFLPDRSGIVQPDSIRCPLFSVV